MEGSPISCSYEVLKLQWSAGPASQSKVLALTLSASMLWHMNALHKATLPLTSYQLHVNLFSGRDGRPQHHNPSEHSDASDAHDSDDGDDLFLEPIAPYGAIFLHDIRLPGDSGGSLACPRMDAHFNHAVVSALPSKAYKGVLGITKEEIMQKYGHLGHDAFHIPKLSFHYHPPLTLKMPLSISHFQLWLLMIFIKIQSSHESYAVVAFIVDSSKN